MLKKRESATYFNELLASRIACIQLDGCQSGKFRTKVRAGRFTDTRGARNKDSPEDIHSVLPWFLEPTLETLRPATIFIE